MQLYIGNGKDYKEIEFSEKNFVESSHMGPTIALVVNIYKIKGNVVYFKNENTFGSFRVDQEGVEYLKGQNLPSKFFIELIPK